MLCHKSDRKIDNEKAINDITTMGFLLDFKVSNTKNIAINSREEKATANLAITEKSEKKEKPPSIIQSIKASGLFSKIFISNSQKINFPVACAHATSFAFSVWAFFYASWEICI